MYVCWECWRAENEFWWVVFFRVLVKIFSTYFSTHDECRDIRQVSKKVEKIETSTREKNCPSKFHFCKRQRSIQTYIGNFVYQGVALNTLGNNGLNKSLGNNGLSRSILVTSGLSMQWLGVQKSNSVGTCAENSAEKWLGVQKSNSVGTCAEKFTFCTPSHFSAQFGVHIWKNAWFWKMWKVTPWYTKYITACHCVQFWKKLDFEKCIK